MCFLLTIPMWWSKAIAVCSVGLSVCLSVSLCICFPTDNSKVLWFRSLNLVCSMAMRYPGVAAILASACSKISVAGLDNCMDWLQRCWSFLINLLSALKHIQFLVWRFNFIQCYDMVGWQEEHPAWKTSCTDNPLVIDGGTISTQTFFLGWPIAWPGEHIRAFLM